MLQMSTTVQGASTTRLHASQRRGGGRTANSKASGITTVTRWFANSAFSKTQTRAAMIAHTPRITASSVRVRSARTPMTAVAISPSATATTMMPSRSTSSDVSLPSWNGLLYSGPLPVWYAIDWSYTRPSPHGSAVANHTTTAVPSASSMSRHLRAEYIHHAMGTSAEPTSGFTASAHPTSTPINSARDALGASRY